MKDRIFSLRKQLKLSQTAFGVRIGLKKSAISKIESGAYAVTEQTLLSICREFHVSPEWLRTGEGEMFATSSAAALGNKFSFKELTVRMLDTFEQLTPEHQEAVLEYAHKVVASLVVPPASPSDTPPSP